MNCISSKKCLYIFIISTIFISNVFSQPATARFLLWKPSAKSMALGGGGVSHFNNAFSSYYNPALLVGVQKTTFSGSYVNPLPFFEAITHSYSGISFQFSKNHYFSVTANIFVKPFLKEKNTSWQAKISYATHILDWLALGAGVSFLNYQHLKKTTIGYENASGETKHFMLDGGVLIHNLLEDYTYKLDGTELPGFIKNIAPQSENSGVNIGISYINFGSEISMLDKALSDPSPGYILSGISYWPLQSKRISIMVTGEIENQVDISPFADYYRTGLEINLYRIFNIRGGYISSADKNRKSFQTFGFGIETKLISLNVANYNSTFLATWHYDASLNWEF